MKSRIFWINCRSSWIRLRLVFVLLLLFFPLSLLSLFSFSSAFLFPSLFSSSFSASPGVRLLGPPGFWMLLGSGMLGPGLPLGAELPLLLLPLLLNIYLGSGVSVGISGYCCPLPPFWLVPPGVGVGHEPAQTADGTPGIRQQTILPSELQSFWPMLVSPVLQPVAVPLAGRQEPPCGAQAV